MKQAAKSKPLARAEDRVAELADMFRLLGDPSRLRIVLTCIDKPVSVSAIAARLDLSLSLVSHHLRLLRAARLVRHERKGKNIFYTAADDHIRRVITDMLAHVAEPDDDAS